MNRNETKMILSGKDFLWMRRRRIVQQKFFWMNRMVRRIFPHCMTFCQTSSVLWMSVYVHRCQQRAYVLLSHRSALRPKWTESAVPLCRRWVCTCGYDYGYCSVFWNRLQHNSIDENRKKKQTTTVWLCSLSNMQTIYNTNLFHGHKSILFF